MVGPVLNTWTGETKERTRGRRSAPARIILFPPDLASKEEQAQLWVVTRIPKKNLSRPSTPPPRVGLGLGVASLPAQALKLEVCSTEPP